MLLFSSLISSLLAASAEIQFNKPKIKVGELLIISCDLSGFQADAKGIPKLFRPEIYIFLVRILHEQETIFLSEGGNSQPVSQLIIKKYQQ